MKNKIKDKQKLPYKQLNISSDKLFEMAFDVTKNGHEKWRYSVSEIYSNYIEFLKWEIFVNSLSKMNIEDMIEEDRKKYSK